LELWDEELNVRKIIAVIDATSAVVKRKPENNSGLYRIRTLDLIIAISTLIWQLLVSIEHWTLN